MSSFVKRVASSYRCRNLVQTHEMMRFARDLTIKGTGHRKKTLSLRPVGLSLYPLGMKHVSRILSVAAVLLTAAPAFATGNVPRTPSLQSPAPIWVGFLLMGLMIALTMAVSLMPSKRGHQD